MVGKCDRDEKPSRDGLESGQIAAALGDRCWRENRYEEALAHYQEAVRDAPCVARYRVQLGQCAWMLRKFEVAEVQLQEALRLAPDSSLVHKVLAEYRFAEGKIERALFHSARACELSPRDAEVIVTRASILHENTESAEACQLIEPLLKAGVCSVPLAVLFGRLAPYVKHEAAALSCITYMLRVPNVSQHGAVRLHFAAAALLDRAGRYDEAFEHARRGKEGRRSAYDPSQASRWIDRHIEYFTPAKLRSLPRASQGNRRPVFIIGMPRSGTTLVEQILASHSQVYGAGELQALPSIRRSAWNSRWGAGKEYPDLLDSMTTSIADEMAGDYLAAISALNGTATYVTDKLPDNFLLLGLIATLFPHSRVIHCTRNPLDTCLSCYMNYFAGGQAHSHDLAHLGAFYRDYERSMVHWKSALEYPLIEVNYESLVGDLAGQTRQLLAQLGLPWEEGCLNYYRSKRPVLTPSSDQVRRPVYASSVGRWKHYAKHLSPLISALGRSVDGWRPDAGCAPVSPARGLCDSTHENRCA